MQRHLSLFALVLISCADAPAPTSADAPFDAASGAESGAMFAGSSGRARFLQALYALAKNTDRVSGLAQQADIDALRALVLDAKAEPIGAVATQEAVDMFAYDRQLETRELPLMQDVVDVLWPQSSDEAKAQAHALMSALQAIEVKPVVLRPTALDLKVDLTQIKDASSFPCTAKLSFAQPLSDGDQLLALDSRHLAVRAVTADGAPLAGDAYRVENGRFVFRAPGATELVVRYDLTPQFITSNDDWGTATGLIIDRRDPNDLEVTSLLWPYNQGQLYPAVNELGAALAVNVDVDAPSDLTVVSTHIARPIPAYDVAISASTDFVLYEGPTLAQGTHLQFYVSKKTPVKTDAEYATVLAQAGAMIAEIERVLDTPYPDARISYMESPGTFGGMEHQGQPNINVASQASGEFVYKYRTAATLAHEAFHGYFGNGVLVASSSDFTVSEGFVAYLERRSEETISVAQANHDARLDCEYLAAAMARSHQPWLVTSHLEDMNQAFSVIPYNLGAGILRMIENQLGRERFDALLAAFYKARVGLPTSLADWSGYLTQATGTDYDAFYATWGNLTGIPTYQTEIAITGNTFAVTTRPEGVRFPNANTVQIPVLVTGTGGESKMMTLTGWPDGSAIDAGFPIATVTLDPNATLLVLFQTGTFAR